mmetsp:Transcript_54377/g.100441  ORF Transcript_54377/g.100441 Transcript_54377/m.100441 type:complete len:174 (-) Transcript_54377:39-560(-)
MIDAVDFELHAAIRGVSMRDYSCPDEDVGCPLTRHVLCAVGKNVTTKAQKMNFMVCWDKTSGKVDDRVKKCAAETKMNTTAIFDCYNGWDGDDLMLAAANAFAKKFPGAVGVPRVEINGKDTKSVDYAALLKLLCATGIDVPACKKTPLDTSTPVSTPQLSMLPPSGSAVLTV